MKNLTQYLKNQVETSETESALIEANETIKENTNYVKNSEESQLLNDLQNGENIRKSKKKKGKRRKLSDPEVKNVAELMSTNLNLLSSNSSTENVIIEDEKSENKKNAFQFMMNNRLKIIGQNSEGKEVESDKYDTRNVRKSREKLENWAEIKGASKRKREYEERGIVICEKLEKRAKKMKEMLRIDENKEFVRKTRRKPMVIESDSESSRDSVQNVQKIKKSNVVKRKRDSDSENSPNEKTAVKPKIKGKKKRKPIESDSEDCKIFETNKKTVKKSEMIQEKRILRERKPKIIPETIVSDESDEEENRKKQRKSRQKIAPIFLKTAPKPKEAPEIIEARRKFLLSELPKNLKKETKLQPLNVEVNFNIFPTISHVQQTSFGEFWKLPKVNLELLNFTPLENIALDFKYPINKEVIEKNVETKQPIRKFKKIIGEIKQANPSYPVYKSFNSLYEKSGKKSKNTNFIWTEKYRANSITDILTNRKSTEKVKKWLENWLENKDVDDSDDFDSNDSHKRNLTQNTIILIGPNGCGKTMTVYAICNDLGFNILELNASSKRTGKKLIQDFQESTKSHQVKQSKCVLLIEDIDIVFEQDEGFLAALSQLIITSKRPIILTTTDETSIFVQKFIQQYKTICFTPITQKFLAVWLQIICLIEGCFVDKADLELILDFFKGDVRKTMLQLQFLIGNGGDFSFKSRKGLDEIWWNLPNLLVNDDKIGVFNDFASNLSISDYFSSKIELKSTIRLKDSLELQENYESYDSNLHFNRELSDYLLSTMKLGNFSIKKCKNKWDLQEKLFVDNLRGLGCLNKKAVKIDYLPYLRNIGKLEMIRAENNTKRGNRFYNYLRHFDINCNDSNFKSACAVFNGDLGL